jgi:Kef-type K+ transport system membrane component KefB
VFWNWVWEPMLFVTIGNSIYFESLDSGIIPRSLIIICSGVTLRTLVTYVIMAGFGYTWREKLFYAVAWTPKATVQAALSGAAGQGRRFGCGRPGAPVAGAWSHCPQCALLGRWLLGGGVSVRNTDPASPRRAWLCRVPTRTPGRRPPGPD